MRDPDRIQPLAQLLVRAWHLNPDQRLAQLVNNAAHYGGWRGGPDVYHCEDDAVERGLRLMLDTAQGKGVVPHAEPDS